MMGVVTRSMLFILCPPDLRDGQICVDTTLIIGFTYVVCKHDEIIGRVKADM